MKSYEEAKEEFIEAWGTFGTAWGINRTMAQIYALLLITPGSLSVEEIMEELSISRGNSSMNLRALIDWQLVKKSHRKGERKEYFEADGSNMWEMTKTVLEQRRNRELNPIRHTLMELSDFKNTGSKESKEFAHVTKQLLDVINTMNDALSHFTNSKEDRLVKTLVKVMKFVKGGKN